MDRTAQPWRWGFRGAAQDLAKPGATLAEDVVEAYGRGVRAVADTAGGGCFNLGRARHGASHTGSAIDRVCRRPNRANGTARAS